MRDYLVAFEAGFNKLLLFLAALVAISIGLFAVLIPLNLLFIKMQLGGIWWLYEGVEYALYTGIFLGAPWVLHEGAHVRVDVLIVALPKNAGARLEQAMDGAGAALCMVLCYHGLRAAVSEFQDGTLPDKDLRIYNWIMMCVFASSFALLTIEFILRVARARGLLGAARAVSAPEGF
jgi:TRAP-type C4-dicarboxylate transport system permease small subunit